jgi:acyl-CoA synthetase (AMP-forming)/AMP-acid ligase II
MGASVPSSLLELLRTRAATAGAARAFVDLRAGRELTYAQLHDAALGLAARLRAQGIGRKAVVALVANDAMVFPLLGACSALGAQLAVVDASLHPLEIGAVLDHAEPQLVLASGELAPRLAQPKRPAVDLASLLASAAEPMAPEDAAPGEAKLVIYTSGSTGSPKGVVLGERALLANARSVATTYELDARDRLLCVLPFYHMNALLITGWAPLLAGATTVVAPLFSASTARSYWAMAAEHRITIPSVTPSIMSALLKLAEDEPPALPPTFRLVLCGAAPLRAELWQRFQDLVGVPVHQGYGLTETTCWAAMTTPRHFAADTPARERVFETVGVPVDCEIRIAATDRSADDLVFAGGAAGEGSSPVGEVEIRGPLLMDGYYRNKALTREVFTADGFLRTGDLGCFDADGLLRIVGRRKEIIIKSGINIVPDEIDAVLRQMPGIADAKTIGLPDEVLGESVCSVCVPREGAAPPRTADVRRFVRERLAAFKCPDRVIFAGHVPRTPTGKARTGELRRIVNGELAAELLGRLDTWKFKRAQPSEREQILARIQAGLLSGRGIAFVAYWGCGTRDGLVEVDHQALERLKEFVALAERQPYFRATLTLILTDVHAAINGKERTRAARYFGQVAAAAREHGFATVWLSELWRRAGFELDAFLAGELKPPQPALASSEEFYKGLVERAAKHSELRAPEEAARLYYDACQLDAVAVERAFGDAVFLTYNGPDARPTLPRLPTMYLYSYKHKRTEKPWFMP